MSNHPSSSSTFDVVIVGRGPVGSTLANLLGMCGIRTLVLEREAKAYHLPRAVHFDDECMRVFQTVGLSEAVLPHVILSPGMRFVDANGRLVLDWQRSAELTPMGWHLSYRFHQPDLEDVLNNGLKRWPDVTVRNRCDVFAIEHDHAAALVRYEDLGTGQLAAVRASYVIGCDGARSLVRRFIGSGMDDLGLNERWLVTDVLLKRERPDLGDYSIQFCNPQRPATYIRGTGNRRRWEITIHPDEDALAMVEPGRVWQLLAPWITPEDAEIERAAVYTFHSAIAKLWRDGRLLLAGDSAHQTPPFLGQGMCAGIRDAANLAWKLHRALRGKAQPDLLDTYQAERAPHVREFIQLAVRLGGLINTKAVEAALAAGIPRDDGSIKLDVQKPALGPALSAENSDLVGRLAPQFLLSDGRRCDDRVGYSFALLADASFFDELPAQTSAAIVQAEIKVIRSDEATGLKSWLDANGKKAILLRPDRYVLGAAHRPEDLLKLLSTFSVTAPVPSVA